MADTTKVGETNIKELPSAAAKKAGDEKLATAAAAAKKAIDNNVVVAPSKPKTKKGASNPKMAAAPKDWYLDEKSGIAFHISEVHKIDLIKKQIILKAGDTIVASGSMVAQSTVLSKLFA